MAAASSPQLSRHASPRVSGNRIFPSVAGRVTILPRWSRMPSPFSRLAGGLTQEDFRIWLDQRPATDLGHYELLNGRIVVTPPAGWPHGRVGSNVVVLLRSYVDARRLGDVLDSSTGFDLPSGDTLEPDVSFVSKGRRAAGPPPVDGAFLKIVPELVVEILSPSTRVRDLTEKKEIYARNGVVEYWVVDTKGGSVTVFARAGRRLRCRASLHGRPGRVAALRGPRGDGRADPGAVE